MVQTIYYWMPSLFECMESFMTCDCFDLFFRYINHSCAPNCVAEVVTFERGYKIIISCLRRVEKGEEVDIFSMIRLITTMLQNEVWRL